MRREGTVEVRVTRREVRADVVQVGGNAVLVFRAR
jgi:predicted PhzF superfamily epimerase YddE/YHI9